MMALRAKFAKKTPVAWMDYDGLRKTKCWALSAPLPQIAFPLFLMIFAVVKLLGS